MPQVYATKEFTRDARRQGIGDDMLCKAADRAERGLIDADYRAGLVKQRVGRRGAFRVLAAFRAGHRCVFLYSFSKSERENIDDDELAHWRKNCRRLFANATREAPGADRGWRTTRGDVR